MPTRETNISRHPGLNPLWKGLKKEWQQQQIAALSLLLLGIVVFPFTAIQSRWWLALVGATAAIGGLYWFLELRRREPVRELYELFEKKPDQIRWVYAVVTERHPFGLSFSSSTYIYMLEGDGSEYCVAIPRGKIKLVSKTLNRVLPHAEFGYTEERDLHYRGEITGQKRFSWWHFDA